MHQITDALAQAYAAKYIADMTPDTINPTDQHMQACFQGCAVVPRPDYFDAIRAHITLDKVIPHMQAWEKENRQVHF